MMKTRQRKGETMTLKIELGPEEEKALCEQARLSGREPEQYARQIIRDHIGAPTTVADELIDLEFVAYCERESDESARRDEVLEATAQIEDSMARVVIEEERAERF
jgi:hypothetical protein